MAIVILVLGLVSVLAGGAMIGMGIPIKEFGLGNTLIMAGVTAVAGGFVLFGLAAAVRQLGRIERSLQMRPATASATQAPAVQHPVPPSAEQWDAALAPVDENPPPTAPKAARGDLGAEWRRVEEQGSGHRHPGVEVPRTATVTHSATEALRLRAAGEPLRAESRASAPRPPREEIASLMKERSARDAEPARKDALFESGRSGSRARETQYAPDQQSRRADSTLVERATRGAAEPQAAAVLKTGVIDGMAYTLFSDGAIEAELPQGMLRFGSIEELRKFILNAP